MTASKNGRPKKPIDYEATEKLAMMMCTQEEIAAYNDVSCRTLLRDEKFCHAYKKGIEKGKMSLRRQQLKLVEEGNPTMAIWLGKQYLGQKDKQEIAHDHNGKLDVNYIEKYLKDK